MPRHSYSYYEYLSPVTFFVFLVVFLVGVFLIFFIAYSYKAKSNVAKFLVLKVFFSSFFVSVTVTVAQILFGFRAVKLKRRDPSIIVINGRYYKLDGFTLGSIAYYNFITIYTIIYVFLQLIISNPSWSVEECRSGADCFYLNYSAIYPETRYPPGIPIENCTLEKDIDEKYVTCYTIGFHPAIGLALLGGFLNIVPPLLFAFYVGIQVNFARKMNRKIMGKKDVALLLCFCLFVLIVFGSSLAFVILVAVNTGIPKDRQSSFEKMFSSESFFGQSIAFSIINVAFCFYPVVGIEDSSIDKTPAATQNNINNEDNVEDDREDASAGENRNETINFARSGASGPSYGTT